MSLKLGKHPATPDERDLKLSAYLDATKLPKVPAQFGHEDKMPLPRLMLGNGPDDTVKPGFLGAGCCVLSFIANAIRLSNAIAGRKVRITGKEVIAAYSYLTGYRIGDDSTDNGTNMRTAMNWWRKLGFRDADGKVHKIVGYTAIDVRSHDLSKVLEACYLMDVGVGVGIMFPDTAMDEFNEGEPWSAHTQRADDGHAILVDALRDYLIAESWGRGQKTTRPFLGFYMDEAYAFFTEESLVKGKSLEGFNATQLEADLKAL